MQPCNVARVIIDILPDVALLNIFDFYVNQDGEDIEAWYTLVHVCRNWRNVVFGSPRRLKLQLRCTDNTPVKKTLDVWPLLPIIVSGYGYEEWGADNIIAILEHNDRIRQLRLFDIPTSQMERVLGAMQKSFLALNDLQLQSRGVTVPVVPASFLGDSAPQLQILHLYSIPFPGLPKLLLSCTHLVELYLRKIPHSGYFSPAVMATGLSALTRLDDLVIEFESPRCRPDWKTRHLTPQTRTLLPALTKFCFVGADEYLDDLVAQIIAPLLDNLSITFFYQLMFSTPQLAEFISRTPKFKEYDEALVEFSDWRVWVTTTDRAFSLAISCRKSDYQLSSLAQICSSVFIPAVEHLYIFEEKYRPLLWPDDIDSAEWLEFLHPLTAVKNLRISREFVPRIAPTLQVLAGGRVTEVLPALQTLFLEIPRASGPVQESIEKFVAARQLSGHPIAVSFWEGTPF